MLMKHAPDLRSRLADVGIPKLIAVGSHDLWPTELHADFAHRIGAELVVYKTGHSPCETTPNALAATSVIASVTASSGVRMERSM